jgi:hypothetical protein
MVIEDGGLIMVIFGEIDQHQSDPPNMVDDIIVNID